MQLFVKWSTTKVRVPTPLAQTLVVLFFRFIFKKYFFALFRGFNPPSPLSGPATKQFFFCVCVFPQLTQQKQLKCYYSSGSRSACRWFWWGSRPLASADPLDPSQRGKGSRPKKILFFAGIGRIEKLFRESVNNETLCLLRIGAFGRFTLKFRYYLLQI